MVNGRTHTVYGLETLVRQPTGELPDERPSNRPMSQREIHIMSDKVKPEDTHISGGEDGDIKPLDTHISSEEADPGDVKPLDTHISSGTATPLDTHISDEKA